MTSAVKIKKLNKGSVIPNCEFEINLGSRISNPAPINATIFGKNFLHKKYMGKIVNTESVIEIILCRSTNVWNSPVFNILKNNCNKICKNNEYEIIFEKAINGLNRVFEIKPSMIFIDPPYSKEDINLILLKILRNNIKCKDTIIIIETDKKEQIVIPIGFTVLKEKIYGKTKLLFLN